MRIDSPLMTNAVATGSFSGSFTGAFDGDITADSVAYANVTGKPALVSSSAQITAFGFSTTDNELTQEEVEDFAGALVATGGTKTGITVTYDDANGNMDFVVASQTDENFTTADHAKLDGIEAGADVTDATNVTAAGALMDSEVTNLADVKAFDTTDYATAAQGTKADAALPKGGGAMTGAITTNSTFDGRDVATDGTKLDGIEASATADQTDAEIRAAVEAATDSNVFTDADHSKLNGIEASATADQSNAEIRTAVEAATDSNVFTDADHSKLNAIEASADVTDATNVTAAGALMDSELTNEAAIKAINQGLATGNNVQFNDLTVAGDLTVSGTTTSINSTNLDVTDKLISINVGGADAASANGGGLFISGANESMTWDNGNSRFNFSDDVHAVGNITLTGTVDGIDIATDVAANTAKNTNVSTNLSATTAAAQITINSSDGTNVVIAEASSTIAGVMSTTHHDKLDGIEAGATADQTLADLNLDTDDDVQFDSFGVGTAASGVSGVIRASNDVVAYYSSDKRLKDNIEVIPNCLSRLKDIRGVEFDWNDKQSVYEGHDIGVIAQEIEKVAPSLVTDRDNGYKAVKYEKLTAILIQAVKELHAKVEELENK